jgi:hypothetical protein
MPRTEMGSEDDVTAHLKEVETWRDILHSSMGSALKMDNLKNEEARELALGVKCIEAIDHLTKTIAELPYTHTQAYALSKLLSIMGAAFVAGKYDAEAPIAKKVRAKWAAHARSRKRTDEGDEIIRKQAEKLYQKNKMRVGNASGTADDILVAVNAERARRSMRPTTAGAIRKRIPKLFQKAKLAR